MSLPASRASRRAALARMLGGAVLLAAALPLGAQPAPSAAAPATLFRGVRVFDGERVRERQDVLVRDGRIAAVGTSLSDAGGVQVISGDGRTLLPGLIDAHTHAFGPALAQALVFGVTTELEMFGDHRAAAAMRAEQRAGAAHGRADLFSAGTLVTAPGGHGTQYGMAIPTLTHPDSAQAFVDARIAEGSDFIKIVLEDGRAYGGRIATLDSATMHAAIAAARRRDKLAVVHVGTLADARAAVSAGANGLVHLTVDSAGGAAFAAAARRQGTFVVPTLSVLRSVTGTSPGRALLEDARFAPYLDAASRGGLPQAFPRGAGAPPASYAAAVATVRALKAAGVPILAGTDAPNPGTAHGASMHGELALLVEAGLTPAEALAAATSVPARVFGLSDRGRIAPGLRADLLLVEGDPTQDVAATRAIAGVWKGGVPVDRAAFARALLAADSLGRARQATVATGDGLVSDFDDGTPASAFGNAWLVTTDAMAGGTSTAAMAVDDGALAVTGTVAAGPPFAWAGVMVMPGSPPMTPVDLSARTELRFRARGDGRTYQVMLMLASRGRMPVTRTFTAGPEWTEHVFRFADFDTTGDDVMGIVIAAGPAPGAFAIRLDDVRLR